MSHNVTGLPVVDSENRVVGVVSDYDMMALEGVAEAQVRVILSRFQYLVLSNKINRGWKLRFSAGGL